MESDWVKVCVVSSEIESQFIEKILLDNNIPATRVSNQVSMHIHLNTNSSIDIYVAKDNAFQAVQILNSEGKTK